MLKIKCKPYNKIYKSEKIMGLEEITDGEYYCEETEDNTENNIPEKRH